MLTFIFERVPGIETLQSSVPSGWFGQQDGWERYMTFIFQHLATGANGDTEIARKGLRVYTVLGLYEMGDSAEYIADEYSVPVAAVHEALAYAADHPDEMEAISQGDAAAERRMLDAMPEHLRLAEDGIREGEEDRQAAIRRAQEARRGAPVS